MDINLFRLLTSPLKSWSLQITLSWSHFNAEQEKFNCKVGFGAYFACIVETVAARSCEMGASASAGARRLPIDQNKGRD